VITCCDKLGREYQEKYAQQIAELFGERSLAQLKKEAGVHILSWRRCNTFIISKLAVIAFSRGQIGRRLKAWCKLPTCTDTKKNTLWLICLSIPGFAVGAAANQILPTFGVELGQVPPQSAPAAPDKVTFTLTLISDGILCPLSNLKCADRDIYFKRFSLETADGHKLGVQSIPFPTVERAKKHFESSVNRADKDIRRTPELNATAEVVGERVLGLFPGAMSFKALSGGQHYELFWTDGKYFWELSGEYLEEVLALEARLKEEGMNAIWTWHKPYVR